MIVHSSAPARIDLAGGTTDIWPLYLFHPQARTINIAIDQRATVEVEEKSGLAIEVHSKDLDVSMRLTSIDYVEDVEPGHPLELILRLLAFFRPSGGLSITTSSQSPAGAGLGGSSALAIALCGAFNALTNCPYSREQLLLIAKNVETTILKIPAGVQDYYPALYGGLNSIILDIMGDALMRHSHLLTHDLESRIVLVYSQESRSSGVNNWNIVRSYLDQDEEIQNCFKGIQEATLGLERALKQGNFVKIAEAIDKDMENRLALSPLMVTDRMKELIEYGKESGAKTAKVCGAGGGGCIMFWVQTPKEKIKLVKKFREKEEATLINFHVDSEGLVVEASK